MAETESFGSDQAVDVICKMWRELGEKISARIAEQIDVGDPIKAMHWATCAEACFWQATGEANSHDVKDVLPPFGILPQSINE